MRCLVTGGAGFIGSNLVDRLLTDGHETIVYDNFSTGYERFLEKARNAAGFSLVRADLLDAAALNNAMQGVEIVFHLAANADVRFGTQHPTKDLHQNTIATSNVLEAMRLNSVRRVVFASTGSIYGEAKVFPTPEDAPFPIQTSLYGASKLAAEGLIQAYSEGFGIQSYIFRFVSILGERYTHGHVFDFYKQLLADPNNLKVLGNGRQRKSYLYVQDCIGAILHVVKNVKERISVFNLGADEYCEVNDSIGWICGHLNLKPSLSYTGGERGWIGDSPFIFLQTSKIRATGWAPALSIRDGVIKTVEFMQKHPWVFENRS